MREEGGDAFIDISRGRAHPRASPKNGAMLFDLVPIFVKKKKKKMKTAQPIEMGLQSQSLTYKPSKSEKPNVSYLLCDLGPLFPHLQMGMSIGWAEC